MQITFNGAPREVPEGTTVAELLDALQLAVRHVAVEVNLQLVPRAHHAECVLNAGDCLEVVTFVGGG